MSEELEQSVLFDHEDEEAILFSPDQIRKRYTGAQANKIEWRREAILMLLAAGWPIRRIKEKLHVNDGTITALAKQSAEKVGTLSSEFAEVLTRLAAGFFGLAATKADEADFKDLMIGGGIALTHARELQSMGLVGKKDVPAIEENRLEAARILREAITADREEQMAGNVEATPATPQPVGTCGVKAGAPLNITSSVLGKTMLSPASTLNKRLVLDTE